jgi:1-acyl-sn-glycerol-3-phosphate acyltransferase
MSDRFYRFIRASRTLLFAATDELILHEERAHIDGGCLLAANHLSVFDSTVLIASTKRLIDWVSIVEIFQTRAQRWFMTGMNCMALDRSRKDLHTTREIVRRLQAGRMVGLFPEAQMRKGEDSVLLGGNLASGVAGLAQLGRAPVIPVVVIGAGQFSKFIAWLPIKRTFIGVNYGKPVFLDESLGKAEARMAMEETLKAAFVELFEEIQKHPGYQKYHALQPDFAGV